MRRLTWGERPGDVLNCLPIPGCGQFAHTLGGSAGYHLFLLGHQKMFMRLTLFAGPLAIAAAPPAMRLFGIVGLAVVMAVGDPSFGGLRRL